MLIVNWKKIKWRKPNCPTLAEMIGKTQILHFIIRMGAFRSMFAKFCLIAHQKKRFLFNTRQEGQYRIGPNITEAEGQDRKMEISGKNRTAQKSNSWT